MNTLGIIGGMSPESTAVYYLQINRQINRKMGGNHSAPLVLYSTAFQEIVDCQQRGDWNRAGHILADAARILEQAGAQAILLATNTMHKVADDIAGAVRIPFLHILDAVAQVATHQGFHTVGLLGTRFTMQDAFYRDGLNHRGIQTLVPDAADQAEIHRIIFDELCVGTIRAESKAFYLQQIDRLAEQGAQAIILGCTEIGLLLQQQDTPVPLLDSTELHVQHAVAFMVQAA